MLIAKTVDIRFIGIIEGLFGGISGKKKELNMELQGRRAFSVNVLILRGGSDAYR